ncbi:MAG: hypothetical protein ABIT05_12460 [Chitinophagaceae bacterium]
MKKKCIIFLLMTPLVFFTGPGCKKFIDNTSYETKINFTYNGQQQSRGSTIFSNIIIVQNEFLFVNFAGLGIKDQNNLFGGDIYITATNPGTIICAYLQPTGSSVSTTGANCQLQSGGNPIDSVAVYWYESGSLNFSYSDCKDLTGAIVPGQKDCAINGTFDLVLTNKNNQKMRLTNGSFSGRLRKYP